MLMNKKAASKPHTCESLSEVGENTEIMFDVFLVNPHSRSLHLSLTNSLRLTEHGGIDALQLNALRSLQYVILESGWAIEQVCLLDTEEQGYRYSLVFVGGWLTEDKLISRLRGLTKYIKIRTLDR